MTKSHPHAHIDTKSALLAAAVRLFSRKGYSAVSTREVADAAEVNLGSIQYYFGSKGKLFIETIRHLMKASGHDLREQVVSDCGDCMHSSCRRLVEFIDTFLRYLLVPVGAEPCRMMIREIFSETSEDPEMYETLVSTMSDEFGKPLEESLAAIISMIAPHRSALEVQAAVRSVLGQCVFYATHRPFQERLMGIDLRSDGGLKLVGRDIARFSLAALGVSEALINEVVADRYDVGGKSGPAQDFNSCCNSRVG